MSYFDTSTPQLKLVDQFFEVYRSRDLNDATPLFSKNFRYRAFPKIADLPDQTGKEHIGSLGPLIASIVKLEHIIREVIEAPGKVVVQWTSLSTLHDGAIIEYDSLSILTLVEENGELKILEYKDFADPEKRDDYYKALSQQRQTA